MRFHRPHEKRLHILNQQLIDRDILLHDASLFRKPLILLQNDSSLWALSPVQDFGERSTNFGHVIRIGEVVHQRIQFFLQTTKALEDGDPGLIDRHELVERHTLDGFAFLNDVLCEEIALS